MKAIHPFPARMAPDAVSRWIEALPPGATVLDPMCGSGVVLRQAIQAGCRAKGFDLDPLAVCMSRVWTLKGEASNLPEMAREVAERAKRRRLTYLSLPNVKRCAETRSFVEYWFAEPQRSQLARLAASIDEYAGTQSQWTRDALFIAMSRLIVTKHVGASLAWDVSHSRPHKVRDTNEFDVLENFVRSAGKISNLLVAEPPKRSALVEAGDSRALSEVRSNSVDAVITSPPYLNAIDYMRGHKLSLVWMGHTIPQLRDLRSQSIGSERTKANRAGAAVTEDELLMVLPEVQSLSTRHRAVILKYTNDANRVAQEMGRVLKADGKMVLVVADSSIRGVPVRSSSIFAWAAKRNGFHLTQSFDREIPPNRRYLPMNSIDGALGKRMRTEKVQAFKKIS